MFIATSVALGNKMLLIVCVIENNCVTLFQTKERRYE